MPLQRSQLPPARCVPELDGASEVPRSDRPIIRRKSDGIHWACKSLQRPQLPPACCVPELDQKATECTLSVCPCSVSKLINDVSPNFLPLPSRAGPIPATAAPHCASFARTGSRALGRSSAVASRQVVREFMASDGPESQNFEASMVFAYGKKNVRPISRRRRELDGAPRRPTGGEAGTLRFRITPELI